MLAPVRAWRSCRLRALGRCRLGASLVLLGVAAGSGACGPDECEPEPCNSALTVTLASRGFTFGTLELRVVRDGEPLVCTTLLSAAVPQSECADLRVEVVRPRECTGGGYDVRCEPGDEFLQAITIPGTAARVELAETFPGGDRFEWVFEPTYQTQSPNECSDSCQIATERRELDVAD